MIILKTNGIVRNMQMIKKRGNNSIKKILIPLFCIVIILILFEASLRLFYPQLVFKHDIIESSTQIFNESYYFPWELKPLTKTQHISVTDEFNVSISTNSLGYRDYEFTIEKPGDIYRILMVGDSTTYGFGVEIDETYIKILEKYLNKGGNKRYSVINAGFKSGRSPDTEYLFIKNEGISLNPDMIMVGFFIGDDFNDYKRNIWELDSEGDINRIISKETYIDSKNRLRNIENGSENGIKEKAYRINVFLSFHSHLYVLFKNTFRNILITLKNGKPEPGIYSLNYSERVERDIETTLDLLLKMKKIAYEHDIKFVILIIPTKDQVYNYNIKDKNNDLLNWTRPNNILTDFGERNNIEMIDILPYLREYVRYNKDMIYFKIDPHWNKNGNYVVGRSLYEEIKNKEII